MKTSVVVTSISGPNPVMQRLSEGCQSNGWDFIVAGDRKTPADFALEGCTFLSLEVQQDPPFRTGGLCPQNSYVRKNMAYLPAHCSFRATDIWRGLVAQRLLTTCDWSLSFHEADVHQDRNPHDLMKDFHQEVPVYLQTRQVVETLQSLPLEPGAASLTANLRTCYEALTADGVVGPGETDLVEAWITDLDAAGWTGAGDLSV